MPEQFCKLLRNVSGTSDFQMPRYHNRYEAVCKTAPAQIVTLHILFHSVLLINGNYYYPGFHSYFICFSPYP